MVSTSKPLNIRAYGFDGRGIETLRLTFKGPGKGCAVLLEQGCSDSAVFNMDNLQGATLLHEYRQEHPDTPVIVMGMHDPGLNEVVFIKKPVAVSDMLSAVHELKAALIPKIVDSSVTISNSADVVHVCPTHSNAQTREVFRSNATLKSASKKSGKGEYFNPHDFMQYVLVEAIKKCRQKSSAVRISICSYNNCKQHIIFVPGVDRILSNLDSKQMRKLCMTPVSMADYKLDVLNDDQTMIVRNRIAEECLRYLSFDSFLWCSGLWVGNGMLPEHTDLTAPVTLRHWPNMTRLTELPNATRISALLIKSPTALPVAAKVLNLPMAEICAFYNAATSIGLVEQGGSVVMSKEQETPHQNRALFKRILGYLHRA